MEQVGSRHYCTELIDKTVVDGASRSRQQNILSDGSQIARQTDTSINRYDVDNI